MGLRPQFLDYISKCSYNTIGNLKGKYMLELGDQMLVINNKHSNISGKELYENKGVHHTSIDLNNQHGALKIDLGKPFNKPEWKNKFDIITNSGTTEHVEPKELQYECFKNIHECLKVGGISIHIVPDTDELYKNGTRSNHCNIFYSYDFFKIISKRNKYKIIYSTNILGLLCVCLQKTEDIPFMEDKDEFLLYITLKE